MRLVLVIAGLEAGGAERVLSTLANAWVAEGHEVVLITYAPGGADFYPLDTRVRRLGLDMLRTVPHPLLGLWRMATRVWRLRVCLRAERPTVVVSFTTSVNLETLMACRGLGLAVVVSERTEPARQVLDRVRRGLRQRLYPWADAVVVQSPAIAAWFQQAIPAARVTVIPNPVATVEFPLAAAAGNRQIMALGRLVPLKGFDLLLRAFARSQAAALGWRLSIVGEGAERARLTALAGELGIGEWVSLPGLLGEPAREYARSPIFVLSSRYEGFPNALLEAMAHGCAVLSFACPSGPAAIVDDGESGLLVAPEDVTALAAGLDRLLVCEALRIRLGNGARLAVVPLAPARVLARWQVLFAGLSPPGAVDRRRPARF